MSISRRTLRMAVLLAIALVAAAPTAWAGGHHHGPYSHSSYSVGLGWAYPPPYWRPYPPGYGYGGHGSSLGLSFAIPLYFGPRYAPQPAPPPAPAQAAPTAYRPADASCLQVREYQTEIVVGGKSVPAYGSACLQPDGSWKPVSGPFPAD